MIREKVLFIAAHPDDEVLGAGGTIAKYADNGADVRLLIMTDGVSSQYRKEPRIQEIMENEKLFTRRSAGILGISEVIFAGLPDMKLDREEHIRINEAIENVIGDFQPDTVFTHFYGDVNIDHQRVFQSTLVACRPFPGSPVRELYSYSVPSSTEWNVQNAGRAFMPNVYVDIDGVYAEKKYAAMGCYPAELREYPHPRSIEALKILDRANGIRVGMKAAECFMLHRWMK